MGPHDLSECGIEVVQGRSGAPVAAKSELCEFQPCLQ